MITDFEKIADTIVNMERSYCVNQIWYDDFKLWPLIRLAIYMQKHEETTVPFQEVRFLRGELSYHEQLLIKFEWVLKSLISKLSNIVSYNLQPNTDVLFFSRPQDRSDKYSGKEFDRYLDPIIDAIKGDFSCMKIELFNKSIFNLKYIKIIYLVVFFEIREQQSTKPIEIEKGKEILDKIRVSYKKAFKHNLSVEWILHYAELIRRYSLFFQTVLQKIKPKVVILVCYYYPIAMALIHACRALDIRVVDVQHGQQGEFHPMYGEWPKMPPEGHELLPDNFWVWSEYEFNNIIRSTGKSTRHTPAVGGYPWPEFFKKNRENFSDARWEAFRRRTTQFEKKIILALSNEPVFEDLIQKHVLSVMKKSGKDRFWLVRLHPQTSLDRIDALEKFLLKQGICNFEVHAATYTTLFNLFSEGDLLITNGSSSCIEALAFDVPSIIVSDYKCLYKIHIDEGVFNYADTEGKLEFLISNLSCGLISKSTRFIQTTERTALKAFEELAKLN